MYRVGRAPVMRPCGAIRREMHRFQDHGGIPADPPLNHRTGVNSGAQLLRPSSHAAPVKSPRTAARGGIRGLPRGDCLTEHIRQNPHLCLGAENACEFFVSVFCVLR